MVASALDVRRQATARVPVAAVWQALAGVPDPELPVVSVVELGVVRDVAWQADTLRIAVTPTYSGCPATDVIAGDIRDAVRSLGVEDVRLDVVLAPPWTTDWIAPEARDKLRTFGIAPPRGGASRIDVSRISPFRRRRDVACPRCGSTHTTLIAQFGSTACKALYRCGGCGEPFDHFKDF
jgi:ring-1,2-phenylacetyl-CoA epoxidase subunit PaaD